MREIGAFEAKTKLGQLLDRVGADEEIVITRRGKVVAKLVPPDAPGIDRERAGMSRASAYGSGVFPRVIADSAMGSPMHSFRSLFDDLGTLTRNTVRRWGES